MAMLNNQRVWMGFPCLYWGVATLHIFHLGWWHGGPLAQWWMTLFFSAGRETKDEILALGCRGLPKASFQREQLGLLRKLLAAVAMPTGKDAAEPAVFLQAGLHSWPSARFQAPSSVARCCHSSDRHQLITVDYWYNQCLWMFMDVYGRYPLEI